MLHDFALNSVHFFVINLFLYAYIHTYTNFGNISGCLLQTTYFVCVILLPSNDTLHYMYTKQHGFWAAFPEIRLEKPCLFKTYFS